MQALIIGSGIGGTATALALRKAGIEALVFEAHDRAADGVGAFLTLAVNGLAALQAIDVPAATLRGGFDTPRMALHLGSGEQLVEFPNGPRLEDGTVSQTIRRSDLYGSLRDEAVRRGVVISYGKRLVHVETTRGRAIARFADGTEAEGDLLIGADGLRSRVRTAIDPGAPPARYVGLLNAGGFASGVEVAGPPGTFRMVFGRRGFFGYVLHPSGDVWWFANLGRSPEPTDAEVGAITIAQWRAELLRLFAPDTTPAAEIIRATPHIFAGWKTYDFPTVPIWHRGRMIIMGDAAHAASPSSGQGASMAIEDAVVLAKCLRDVPGVEAAFSDYEGIRRERVERVVVQGRRNGTGKAPGPVGRRMRDLVLRLVFRRGAPPRDTMRWLFEHRIDWNSRARQAA